MNNLGKPEMLYQSQGVAIKRIIGNIGILYITGRIHFNSGTLIDNMYKYYPNDLTFEENPNFIDEIAKYINLYQAIPLYGVSQDNHFFCVLGANGIMQMVGNGEWRIATSQLVFLK